MKKSIAVIKIALTVLGSGAAAQIGPCPDAIGVYFDLDANLFDTAYPGGFMPLDVYLILTNPTGDHIRSWECRINEVNNFTIPGVWTVIGGTDTDGDPLDFVVTMDGCPVAASINVLASKKMYGAAPGAGSCAYFGLAGIPGSTSFPNGDPGYVHTPGINTPLQAAIGFVGNSEYPQAWVNRSFESWIACQTTNLNFGVDVGVVLDGMSDYDNWAGAFSRAWDWFDDRYDLPEPPPSPDGFVSLAFPHPEWNASVGDDFKTDTRSLYDPVHYAKTWPLRLSSSSSGLATLSFQPDFGQSSGWGLGDRRRGRREPRHVAGRRRPRPRRRQRRVLRDAARGRRGVGRGGEAEPGPLSRAEPAFRRRRTDHAGRSGRAPPPKEAGRACSGNEAEQGNPRPRERFAP